MNNEYDPFQYFDRQGNRITQKKWSDYLSDEDYKIVRQEDVNNFFVSTIWLGMNHCYEANKPPLIFETMVFQEFPEEYTCEGLCLMRRYSTEEEALIGHEEVKKDLLEYLDKSDLK